MKISLRSGDTGASQWRDCLLISPDAVVSPAPGGWSDSKENWGNAAYAGGQCVEVTGDLIILVYDRGDHWRAEAIAGSLPKGFPEVFSDVYPGELATRFGLITSREEYTPVEGCNSWLPKGKEG